MAISPSVHTLGTVSVTNGSATVTGVGTGFALNGVTGGVLFVRGALAIPILSVESDTSLTLAYTYPGTTQAGLTYAISRESALAADATFVHNRLVGVLEALGVIENSRPNYGVLTALTNAPPGSPVAGGLYIVGTVPTGAWAGRANNLAQWTGAAWIFTAPDPGTLAATASDVYVYGGGSWVAQAGGTATQALRALTAAAGSFARFSGAGAAVMQPMVGTVAQAAGVPTGAIVERGSNANGEFVKYADGTMMCWRITGGTVLSTTSAANGLYRTDAQPVSFPATFSAIPFGIMNIAPGNGWMGVISAMTTTQWSYQLLSIAAQTSAATAGMSFFAVGRWF